MSMTLVSTVTVGAGGATEINFTGIAGTATDLVLLASIRTNRAFEGDVINVQFNNDTGSNYANRYLQGTGSSVGVASYTHTAIRLDYVGAASATSNTFGNLSLYIPNYASSVAKSGSSDIVMENNATLAWQSLFSHGWTGTAAISSIKMTSGTSSTFLQNTVVSLYQITKA